MGAVERKKNQAHIELMNRAIDQGGLLVHRVGKHGGEDNRWMPMPASAVPRAFKTMAALADAKSDTISGSHLENVENYVTAESGGLHRRHRADSGRADQDQAAV